MINPRAPAALVVHVALLLLGPAGAVMAVPPAGCVPSAAALPAVTRLRAAMAHGRFVAYQPTSLQVVDGQFTDADPASIRADLTVLRPSFDALVTYDAIHGVQNVAPIAAALKFRALVIGVWDPLDAAQLDAAIEAARRFPHLVVGISLGNEMLFSHHTDAATLAGLISRVRMKLPDVALSTTEPFHIYYQPDAAHLLGQLDFLLVNVHPIFQPWFRDAPDSTAAQFVVNVLGKLAPLACGPILVKETGVPSAPDSAGFSETRQADFYHELRRALPATDARAFAYFAAFDAPWRAHDATPVPGVHPEEAHWGLFDAQRRPKRAARELLPLPPLPPR